MILGRQFSRKGGDGTDNIKKLIGLGSWFRDGPVEKRRREGVGQKPREIINNKIIFLRTLAKKYICPREKKKRFPH